MLLKPLTTENSPLLSSNDGTSRLRPASIQRLHEALLQKERFLFALLRPAAVIAHARSFTRIHKFAAFPGALIVELLSLLRIVDERVDAAGHARYHHQRVAQSRAKPEHTHGRAYLPRKLHSVVYLFLDKRVARVSPHEPHLPLEDVLRDACRVLYPYAITSF